MATETVNARETTSDFAERDADLDGVRLHYRSGGSGPPVVLLHGFAETSAMWDPLLPVLSGSHTVVAPDLRGAGASSKPPGWSGRPC